MRVFVTIHLSLEDSNKFHKRTSLFQKAIEDTAWLEHMRRIMESAVSIAHWNVVDRHNVLVHCSDGWDRTPQLTSLVMLMLDPFYRTISGFIVLIEQEWFVLGHKFKDRGGFSINGWGDPDRSPIFEQFLHCVYQMLYQKARIFEFNENMLLFLVQHTCSGWFANFTVNSDRERSNVKDKGFSLWQYIEDNRSQFTNENYENESSSYFIPMVSAKHLVLWQNRFLGWHNLLVTFNWSIESLEFEEEVNSFGAWFPEADKVKECSQCGKKFTFFNPRALCKVCLLVLCDSCLGPSKICENCRILDSPLSRAQSEHAERNRISSNILGIETSQGDL